MSTVYSTTSSPPIYLGGVVYVGTVGDVSVSVARFFSNLKRTLALGLPITEALNLTCPPLPKEIGKASETSPSATVGTIVKPAQSSAAVGTL